MSRFSVGGRVAVITGGGTGIGKASALVLAEHGADIVIAGRRREPLDETAHEIEALGRRVLVVPTDVVDIDQCERLIRLTTDQFGRLDILVNNAGGATTRPLDEWTPAAWNNVLHLNISSVWYLSRFASTPMLAQGKGAIVNISSGAAYIAMPVGAPYGASKAAVNSLTLNLSAAWAPQGIRVNGIACGAVRTALILEDSKQYGLDEAAIGASNAMNRMADPDEIGYTVLFFASDASSFCTGETLWVNGGRKR
jgi:NAD(P)-dependent dehydrogenase (short-subunit alcohol dehydrogenase family)